MLDPRIHQAVFERTGSPLPPQQGEAFAHDELAVVARLDADGAFVDGMRVVSRFGPVVTARVKLADLERVRQHPAVRSLKTSRLYTPALEPNTSPPASTTFAEDYPQRKIDVDVDVDVDVSDSVANAAGAGVVVGFLDWGVDVTHHNLRDAAGNTRIRAIWDQRGGNNSKSPPSFGYGRVHSRAEIDVALRGADPHQTLGYDHLDADPDLSGTHGTHVVDIAVGNGRAKGSNPSAAPGAEILFVHLRGDDTAPEDTMADSVRLLEGIAWLVESMLDRRDRSNPPRLTAPLVIHLSAGTTGGPHDASPLVVRAIDHLLAETPGLAAVMSCGNYHDARLHASATVQTGASVNLAWDVTSTTATSEVELWYSPADTLSVELFSPAGTRVLELPADSSVLAKSGQSVAYSGYHRRAEANSGSNVVNVFVQPPAVPGRYVVRVNGVNVKDGRFHAWIERAHPKHQSRFAPGVADTACTTNSVSNGRLSLAVAAFDSHSAGQPIGKFSSSGPTRDGRRKPDVAAPGVRIVAAKSSTPAVGGGRDTDGVTEKTGTSMAAPHVTSAVANVMSILRPRLIPAVVSRWLIMESVDRHPPDSDLDAVRYGVGRLNVAAARALALGLRTSIPERGEELETELEAPKDVNVTDIEVAPELTGENTQVYEWLTLPAALEVAVGQLQLPNGTTLTIEPRQPSATADNLDAAVRLAFAAHPAHTVIRRNATSGFDVAPFGPPASLIAPPTLAIDGGPSVAAVVLNGGERVYFPTHPAHAAQTPQPGSTRWVDVPGLAELYRLTPADFDRHVNAWAGRLADAEGITVQQARGFGVGPLRVRLAQHAARAFPVCPVRRGTPPADVGGIVEGLTVPRLQFPLLEPQCYLPVIAQVEGKLESINAWDLGAGVSLGPIQFNADRAALFTFLSRLWDADPELFASALTGPLGWTVNRDGDHADLLVAGPSGTDRLHGRATDAATNAGYLQSGQVGQSRRNPPYRRRVAGALRDCVAWPHVQDIIADVSGEWLAPALRSIQAEVGHVDLRNPDEDTFVLTAILLSARVRFSACLAPLLRQLRRWTTPGDKLANWPTALAATNPPCPELEARLRRQVNDARHVYAQIQRLRGTSNPAEAAAGSAQATVDRSVAVPPPAAPYGFAGRPLSSFAAQREAAWNQNVHPSQSGVTAAILTDELRRYVDMDAVRAQLHQPAPTEPTFDPSVVHAILEFQRHNYREENAHDGRAGASTLDSLGLVQRPGLNPVRRKNAAAAERLRRADARLTAASAGQVTAATWWDGMVNPAWLGFTFTNGVHTLLMRHLREAEAWLLDQPTYRGLDPVELGARLGIVEQHHGARPNAPTASMHTYGLAVDIGYTSNPWIGGQHVDGGNTPSPAGQVTVQANRHFGSVVERAALIVGRTTVTFNGKYLDRLSSGDAGTAWDDLRQRNDEFVTYLRLADNPTAAAQLLTHPAPGAVHDGETPGQAAQRWAGQAASDLRLLRAGPVEAVNGKGVTVKVSQSNFAGRDPLAGFMSLPRILVVALRDHAGLAWGAIDFGVRENGDIMHFDCRRSGVGAFIRSLK